MALRKLIVTATGAQYVDCDAVEEAKIRADWAASRPTLVKDATARLAAALISKGVVSQSDIDAEMIAIK